jgi:hypothetical protein
MKELLIKIKALFEGSGAAQAEQALKGVDAAADKASGSAGKLGSSMSTSQGQSSGFAGVIAGATAALTTFALDAAMKAVTAVVDLGKAFAAGILQISDFAGKMTDLAARTGQPISDLVVLEQAFKNAGLSAEQVGPAINKVQNAIVNAGDSASPAAAAFGQLGIKVDSFRQLDSVGQFNALATAVGSIKDPAQQTALMMDLFGRSGGQMLAVFKDSTAFTTAATQVGSLGANLEKAAPALDAFSDAYNSIDVKKQQFFAGAAAQFATELERAGVALNNLDLGPLGEQVGLVIRGAIEVSQSIAEWVTYFKQFTDAIGATGPIIDGLTNALKMAFDPLGITTFIGYLKDTGQAAVEHEEAQKRVDEALKMQANSAQIAGDFIAQARSEAQGLSTDTTQAGTEAINNAATAAGGKVTEAGTQAQTGIQTTSAQGAQQITLTAQQIQTAAQQLAAAFQQGLGQDISPALQALVNAVQANLTTLATSIQATSQQMTTSTQASSQQIQTSIQGLATSLTTTTQQTATTLAAAVPQITTAITGLTTAITTALTTSQTSITTAMPAIQTALTSFQTTITSAFTQLQTSMTTAASTIQSSIAAANLQASIQAIVTAVQTGFTTLNQSLSSAAQGIGAAAQAINAGNQQMSQGIQQLTRAATESSQRLSQTIAQGVQQIGASAANNDRQLAGAISNVANALSNAVSNLQSQINILASRR